MVRLATIAATTTAIYYPIWAVANDVVSRGRDVIAPALVIFTISLSLDLALLLSAKNPALPKRFMRAWISVYLVLRCAMLSIDPVVLDGLLGMPPSPMTFTCVAAVMFPMLVPAAPARLAVPTLLALSTQPLAVWVFGESPLQTGVLLNSVLTAILAGALAYASARVTWGLRVTAARARDVGAYELISPLGRGAMGEVWRGHHRLLARPAAIKLMPYDRSDPAYAGGVRHFEREARITASLTSPHTVRLFDYGVTDIGSVYYVMELCDGSDLQALVERQGPVSPAQAIDIALQICDSLGEAHHKGLVHRDLKPANVMQCEAGRRRDFVKVLDFGLAELARRLNRSSHSSSDSSVPRVAGTPAYMAPEVVRGLPVDHRADIYQLGCVIFFLLTGRLVFDESTPVAVALGHANSPPPLMRDVSDRPIPAALERIVQKCLEKEPSARFQSAEELEHALQLALEEPNADRRHGVRHPDALTEH